MKESKNNIANRNTNAVPMCPHCNKKVKHIQVIRMGKKRMTKECGC